MRKSLRNLLDF